MSEHRTGACKCNEVRFEIESEVETMANCHCDSCRRMSGAAFATVIVVDEKGCEVIAGRDEPTAYQVTEHTTKRFCRKCGTPVYYLNDLFPGKYRFPIGSLDDPTGLTPALNVHCESMFSWVRSIDDIESFEQLPG